MARGALVNPRDGIWVVDPPRRPGLVILAITFLVGGAVGAGAAFSYMSIHQRMRESAARPGGWNVSAIQARFRNAVALNRGRPPKVELLYYVIHNNTDSDYLLEDGSSATLFLVGQGHKLFGIPEALSENIKLSLPIFVPARHEIACGLVELNGVTDHGLARMVGFEIFDQRNHYEIVLPKPNAVLNENQAGPRSGRP